MREKHHVKHVQKVTLHKLYLLILMTVLFTAFWYPVFVLTASDPSFSVSPAIYKALTIFAWSNPTVTPFVHFLFIKTACCCREHDLDMPSTPSQDSGDEEVQPGCSRSPTRPLRDPGRSVSWDLSALPQHDSSPKQPRSSTLKGKKSKPASLWI